MYKLSALLCSKNLYKNINKMRPVRRVFWRAAEDVLSGTVQASLGTNVNLTLTHNDRVNTL